MARSRFEMWGESLRELGVLLLVFVPLDILIELMHDSRGPTAKHYLIVLGAGVGGLVLMCFGVEMERKE